MTSYVKLGINEKLLPGDVIVWRKPDGQIIHQNIFSELSSGGVDYCTFKKYDGFGYAIVECIRPNIVNYESDKPDVSKFIEGF